MADHGEARAAFARLLCEASDESVLLVRGASETGKSHMSNQMIRNARGLHGVVSGRFDFKGTTGKQSTFLATAMALEDTGVSAHAGAAPMIANKKTLAAALSVHSVEARHAAWVRDILGHGANPLPAPAPFDPARSKADVLKIVTGTGFIAG